MVCCGSMWCAFVICIVSGRVALVLAAIQIWQAFLDFSEGWGISLPFLSMAMVRVSKAEQMVICIWPVAAAIAGVR